MSCSDFCQIIIVFELFRPKGGGLCASVFIFEVKMNKNVSSVLSPYCMK